MFSHLAVGFYEGKRSEDGDIDHMSRNVLRLWEWENMRAGKYILPSYFGQFWKLEAFRGNKRDFRRMCLMIVLPVLFSLKVNELAGSREDIGQRGGSSQGATLRFSCSTRRTC